MTTTDQVATRREAQARRLPAGFVAVGDYVVRAHNIVSINLDHTGVAGGPVSVDIALDDSCKGQTFSSRWDYEVDARGEYDHVLREIERIVGDSDPLVWLQGDRHVRASAIRSVSLHPHTNAEESYYELYVTLDRTGNGWIDKSRHYTRLGEAEAARDIVLQRIGTALERIERSERSFAASFRRGLMRPPSVRH